MRRFAAIGLLACATGAAGGCLNDPVHDGAVGNLGGEVDGVRPGPNHRPGQPCLTCHGGSGPGKPTFSVAGTVYRSNDVKTAVAGVQVSIADATGEVRAYLTNEAGNFYVESASWTPVYPLLTSLSYRGVKTDMNTRIARDGSCGSCHGDPQGPAAVGHIFVVPNDADFPKP